ncbi:hypothetical protein HYQ46_010635 [Verticillium longisporum]|nr:hypothetical protein HYQ46_010635 [Verticillium longisporum]
MGIEPSRRSRITPEREAIGARLSVADCCTKVLRTSESQEVGDASVEVRGHGVLLRTVVTREALCEVHECPAARRGDLRVAHETSKQRADERVQVGGRIDGIRDTLRDATKCSLLVRTLHNSAEGRDGSVTVVPVLVPQVGLDELENRLDDGAANSLSV